MCEWQNVPEDYKDYLGFVYIITHKPTGRYYIGKKQFWSRIRRKPLKGRTRARIDLKESNWRNYWGSAKKLLAEIKSSNQFEYERKILSCHDSKFDLAYAELKEQIERNVLFDNNSYNEIVNIRLRRKKRGCKLNTNTS